MGYQNKDVFYIPDNLNIFSSVDDILNSQPFQKLKEAPELQYLIQQFKSFKDLAGLLAQMPGTFLETVHGINRAFNSSEYDNLNAQATIELSSLNTNSYQNYLINGVTKAYNQTLDIDYLKEVLQDKNIQSQQLSPDDPYQIMSTWQQSAMSTLSSAFQQAKSQLQALLNIKKTRKLTEPENKQKIRLTWAIFDFEKIYDKLAGNDKSKARSIITPITPITEIISDDINQDKLDRIEQKIHRISALILRGDRLKPDNLIPNNFHLLKSRQLLVPITTVGGAITIMHEMATLFLSFLGVPASVAALPALAYAATSMVLKILGSGGAIVARYFAGSILRGIASTLPAIVQKTGMWGMAWAFLAPFAPWIIFTAVKIIIGIRSKVKLADRMYFFGSSGLNPKPDFSFLMVSETNNREIYQTLIEHAETMKANSGKTYSTLYGFTTYKEKPQFGLNLTNSSNIIPLTDAELNTILPANLALFDNWLS